MKRQQYACDQCRKSKRGCDAPPLDIPKDMHPFRDGRMIVGEKPPLTQPLPCSYCVKTNKKCSMRWAWTQIQVSYALAAAAQGESEIECIVPAKRQSSARGRASSQTQVVHDDAGLETDATGTLYLAQPLPSVPVLSDAEMGLPSFELPPFLHEPSDGGLPFSFMPQDSNVLDTNFTGIAFDHLSATPDFMGEQWDFPKDTMSQMSSEFQLDAFSFPQLPVISASEPDLSLAPSSSSPYGTRSDKAWDRKAKRRRVSAAWSDTQASTLSCFSADQSMMARSNNQLISTSLLQIYHDVLEHNLSCWLTEATCPFGTSQKDLDRSGTVVEWGSSWTNRILRRTLNLDRAAQSTQLVRMTKQEDAATTKALHLCIMAFATQWAQGSRRQKEQYPSLSCINEDSQLEECLDEFTQEFDRNLQRNIWEQAQRALQQVADVESYRVVCAEMIFGLTQKPLAHEDDEDPCDESSASKGSDAFDADVMADEIARVIENDGPPIYMERAARKMHTLKYRYDAERKGIFRGRSKKKRESSLSLLSNEDRGTISLLYWLTVMFDTISSSMAERPLVVADANSQHEDAKGGSEWNVPLFIQDNLDKPSRMVHWPCSYEEAAEAVTKSAPVKVLLFRHVAYLQGILRQGERGERVEEIIERSASVYRYWNMTHGSFFRELLQNYESIPARIQSWFICISAHWHLGALLLADLIEHIDENQLGITSASQNRKCCKWVMRIRERSAKELSDLAQVATTPEQDMASGSSAAPQLSEFHHAINEAMILTEPWTVIVIRAFSKAASYLLSEANDLLQFDMAASGHDSSELQERFQRAEECIKGLWLLGKKSDIARKVAGILSKEKTKLQG
ncbi:hypothetical protein F66182_8137 [Fusarium sp. NRRL 66182]|nr:hypothetical protein F66182_8137 [Fusarium sp. NRRL 66182]